MLCELCFTQKDESKFLHCFQRGVQLALGGIEDSVPYKLWQCGSPQPQFRKEHNTKKAKVSKLLVINAILD